MNHHLKGFTIVELLVVIVTTGILASIVIVSYNGFQNRAHDTAITSDLTTLADELEIYRTHSGLDRYPSSYVELQNINAKLTRNSYKTNGVSDNAIICTSADFKTFIVIALSQSGNVLAANKDGITTYPQAPATFGTAACASVYGLNATFMGWQSSAWQGWVDT